MKKLFVLCSLIFCLLLGSVNVFAEDKVKDENSSTKLTVSFKSGTGSYKVNGKTVKAEASAVVKGKVFVPVNIITDTISATLKVDLKKKTATINYNGVEIKLTDKKKEALIAGKKVTMDAAPYIKNSSFMVSISFLADTLGADLTNTNGQVTFVKEIANSNSIKDFGTLIKKTSKDKVGDSYYKWSMNLPDDLNLDYRDFNGSENEFYATDGSYLVDVYIYDRTEKSSLENVENYFIEHTKEYTLIDYGKRTNAEGIDYVEFIYRDDKQTYQYRVLLSDTKEYDILIITLNDDSYLDEKYQDILESFKFEFDKDGSTEDLSDVSTDGLRKYQDTKLKWSINMHPDWEENKDKKIQNKVTFNGKDDEVFSVEVYSINSGENLDSITQDEIDQLDKKLNHKLYTLTKQESTVIGGKKCNKFYYTIKYLDKTYYDCVVCFADKNYKYILNYENSEKGYNDSTLKKKVEGIISSFTFTELNTTTIGKLLDPDKIVLSNKYKSISEDLFSINIPTSWVTYNKNTDTYKAYYNGSGSEAVSVNIYNGNSLYAFINYYDEKYQGMVGDDFKIESKEYITVNDKNFCKYIIVYEDNGHQFRDEVYLIQKGSHLYCVTISVNNLFYGTNAITIFSDIWRSFILK